MIKKASQPRWEKENVPIVQYWPAQQFGAVLGRAEYLLGVASHVGSDVRDDGRSGNADNAPLTVLQNS